MKPAIVSLWLLVASIVVFALGGVCHLLYERDHIYAHNHRLLYALGFILNVLAALIILYHVIPYKVVHK